MVIGQVLIAITLCFALPINIPPCRDSILKICFKYDEPKTCPFWIHAIVSLCLLLFSLAVALFYPDILSVFSFLGGFCGVFMVLVFPTALHVKISDKPITYWKNLGMVIGASIFSCVGFTSVGVTVAAMAS
jgi:hypothetical protein